MNPTKIRNSLEGYPGRYLVPLIFETYAQDLAERVAALNPASVLETAAGSGVVARAPVPLLPSDAEYTVTDLNQPMLDHAANKQEPDSRVTAIVMT